MIIKSEYVSRVNQLDGLYLNRDVVRLTRDSLLGNLQQLCPQIFFKIQPELDLALHATIWFFSVGKRYSTFGQQLLVLSYDKKQLPISKLYLHFVLTVLPSYIKSVDEQRLNIGWMHETVKWAENTSVLVSIFNFFRFLNTGSRLSLVDFFLGLEHISLQQKQRRDIGYKYLNRELLWGGFMEMLGLILPIINLPKIMGILKKKVFITKALGREFFVDIRTCSYCGEKPTVSQRMQCGHIYCYYCLTANVAADIKFSCVLCGADFENKQMLL